MKNIVFSLVLLFALGASAQKRSAYKNGEWLKFRIHYGIFNASFATLKLESKKLDTIPVYHVVGKGRTTGLARVFFKVDDTYESYRHLQFHQ